MSKDVLFSKKSALRTLKSTFGYDDFRPGQLDVLKSLAKKRDILVVMPTGKGKSLCYQIPAICSRGTALVVSPLIALMKDQVDELQFLKVKAGLLNSTLTREETDHNLSKFERGKFDILYVTPERFKVESFRRILARTEISFLAIDEAHCHPAGTKILTPTGISNIEDLEPCKGDSPHILTSAGPQPVMSLKRRTVSRSKLLSFTFSDDPNSPMDVTEDHPVFLAGVGYVPAGFLKKGDSCYAADSLSSLREGIPVWVQGARPESVDFLFSGMLEESSCPFDGGESLSEMLYLLCEEGFLSPDLLLGTVWCVKGSRCCVGSNDPRQSNELSRCASEGIHFIKGSGFTRGEAGWKRPPHVYTTGESWEVVSFVDIGVSSSDREDEVRATSRSESGLGISKQETCDRSGRYVSQGSESPGSRSQEGGRTGSGRMVAVESIERGCDVRSSSSEIEVFSLEVGGPHNYFAEGILVHNCISQWGHDFRIDYRRLGGVRKLLGVPTIALTATATVMVQDDIVNQLQMEEGQVNRHIYGFDRPNLFYQIKSFDDSASRDAEFSDQIRKMSEGKVAPAIIYCGTRKQCEHVTVIVKKLTGKPIISYYHAGMKSERRKSVQEAFMKGDVPWVAATNAFGMGVNKPDVRHVLHYGLPGSIEAWYQEVGRAGRDEQRSDCITMYTRGDVSLLWYFIELSNPSREAFKNVWDVIWQFKEPIVRMTYKDVYKNYVAWFGKKNPQGQIETAIQLLKKAGAIDNQSPRGQLILADYPKKKDVSRYLDFDALYQKRQKDVSKLRQLIDFVEDKRPIRERVLKYFGEK